MDNLPNISDAILNSGPEAQGSPTSFGESPIKPKSNASRDESRPQFEAIQFVPSSLRRREKTAEEEAVAAMLPFAFVATLLIAGALGMVQLRRALRAMRSESVIQRLREAREASESRESRARKAKRAEEELESNLYFACHAFEHAGDGSVKFKSVGECMALIPDLVFERRLRVEHARVLEGNVSHLTVTRGVLRSKAEERNRAEYLDSVSFSSPSQLR